MNAVITTIIKRLAVIISVFAIAWCLVDPVFAEGDTYLTLETGLNEANIYFNNSSRQYLYYKFLIANNSSDVRVVCFRPSNTIQHYVYLVSQNSFDFGYAIASNSVPSDPATANYSATLQENYYVFSLGYTNHSYQVTGGNLPVITGNANVTNAIYYTYGEGAVGPTPEITYGLLDDVGFTTDIAGSGNASTSNLDTISWNPVYDTNGNNIMGASVSIRAVPGHYSADSKQNLFEKVRSDFILDNTDLAVLDTVDVETGCFSITWGQVISAFSLPFGNFISWFKTDEVFLKQGWIYQIQFTKGEYTSEWQTVYTIQSESPADSLHVINSTVIDQDIVSILQQINTVNNSSNIWIINETPVDPNDNYTPPASDDEKPWWAYLLEMINNSIGVTNQYINNGTDESQQVVNNIETNNNDLDVTVTEYHDIENDLVTDMNDKVTDLDIEEDLSSDASFLSSARWVTEQFNTIVSNNPIGMILKFSLVLGFVTIFLGRFR